MKSFSEGIFGGMICNEEKGEGLEGVFQKERGYFRKDELRMIYHGWDILEYKETSTANMPSWHECVLLIARKPFK